MKPSGLSARFLFSDFNDCPHRRWSRKKKKTRSEDDERPFTLTKTYKKKGGYKIRATKKPRKSRDCSARNEPKNRSRVKIYTKVSSDDKKGWGNRQEQGKK